MKANKYINIILYKLKNFLYNGKLFLGGILLLMINPACEEFTEIDPPVSSLIGETVFTNDATATSSITGIYSRMVESSRGFATGRESISFLTGLSSDELLNFSSSGQIEFFDNEVSISNLSIQKWWGEFYRYIYTANSIINRLAMSQEVNVNLKRQLEGEAKFVRALCHFYLVNLFGPVPIVTTSDQEINALVARNDETEVYDQIIIDLKEAQALLEEEYVSAERIRPNRASATALLARVYLYTGNWVNAEKEATLVIENELYNLESDLNNVFLINSVETIWQIQSIFPNFSTFEATTFILNRAPRRVSLNDELVNAFEVGDNRILNWVGSITPTVETFYFPFKYKAGFAFDLPPTEYLVVFRLAEQYLIRAEARVRQGNMVGAQADLNAIRNRAGLANTSASDVASLEMALEQERKVELFTEWGHRWFDLKRTGRIDLVLSNIKLGWQSTDQLFPLPELELDRNPNLNQNLGY